MGLSIRFFQLWLYKNVYYIRRILNLVNNFWEKIKNLRKYKKITQEKLAKLIDIDVRQVARIEAGESLPSIPTLLKFCSVLSVTPNDLLSFSSIESTASSTLKSDINDILSLAKEEQLQLIKKLILAIL